MSNKSQSNDASSASSRAAAYHNNASGVSQPAVQPLQKMDTKNDEGIIQRAITVGNNPLPRTNATPSDIVDDLKKDGLYEKFVTLNDDRTKIYVFSDKAHLINYLKELAGKVPAGTVFTPFIHKLSPEQLQQGHEMAQDMRFLTIYKPGPSQISTNASGAHAIPEKMMPPPGQGHYWGHRQDPSAHGSEYVLYQNQLQPPQPTSPLTFGDPGAPSLVMHQNGLNLGMHIQPTNNGAYIHDVKRSQTRYAGIPSVTNRVRGHPFELDQNQKSTDDPGRNFDNDARTYTDESDSTKTKGGISSWRYNEVEKKAVQSGMPFTQINSNPAMGPMGIVRPDSLHFRLDQGGGSNKDLHLDNTATTDYRNTGGARPKRMGQQAYQTEMGRQSALTHPYQAPPVHHMGQDFTDPQRHSYPGYASPPPSPFLAEETLSSVPEQVILDGYRHQGDRVNFPNGDKGIVVSIVDRDMVRGKSRCMVKRIPATAWPSTFPNV
ncbi:hypothetical protein F0L74_12895 [Chitinophaga agrisoli]|uniref:Uncharacterized protein n=1 Tax=Chitinophaga agrisoli TaxID=2607653 RepID=A0A5B2VUB4_9BACT|nr:hypothetical protein [Chitinophaga agrisoli]KAA2243393.1 hypothetical protein F0L74_12895 [Chitinophaga agrisoli]